MQKYSQSNVRWGGIKLGFCNTTISESGCFITSLGMLCDKEPSNVNNLLKNDGGYSASCMVNSEKAAEILGLNYKGKTYNDPKSLCIAETDHYKSKGVPQHFFVWLGNGKIWDSLDGKEKLNPYKIISYRLFSPKNKETPMTEAEKQTVAEAITIIRLGNKIKNHVNYVKGKISNNALLDYARNEGLKDGTISYLWRVTNGVSAPKSELDFWLNWLDNNKSKEVDVIAADWYKRFVASRDNKISKLTAENKDLETDETMLVDKIRLLEIQIKELKEEQGKVADSLIDKISNFLKNLFRS